MKLKSLSGLHPFSVPHSTSLTACERSTCGMDVVGLASHSRSPWKNLTWSNNLLSLASVFLIGKMGMRRVVTTLLVVGRITPT